MRIHVDGDACPVKNQVIDVGAQNRVAVRVYIDVNHIYKRDGVEVITVDQGPDSVDMAIINSLESGDVVVTNDYGLASLVLGKGGFVMDGQGREFTNDNIDRFLFERHLHREIRQAKKRHKGPKKRERSADMVFTEAFNKMIQRCNRQI